MSKLSNTQEALLAVARAAGPAGTQQPDTGGQPNSGRVLSAWHRTAASLERQKLAKRRTNGSVWWLVAL